MDRAETASEALVVPLNETGQIHWPRMEAITGKTSRELQHELGALVYQSRTDQGERETVGRRSRATYFSGALRFDCDRNLLSNRLMAAQN